MYCDRIFQQLKYIIYSESIIHTPWLLWTMVVNVISIQNYYKLYFT